MRERWPIPRAKTAVPALPAGFVPRPRLRRRLHDHASTHPLTLVCAPAGHGRTLLLADWCADTGAEGTIWLTLDDDDNDVDRLWAVLLAAVHARTPDGVPGAEPSPDVLADVVDVLAGLPDPTFVVLDDLHRVTGEDAVRAVAGLVQYLPDNVRLVLSSRVAPPLPLPRLRLRGVLAELRTAELCLSHDEATALLRAAGADLTADQVAGLLAETGGWPAGVRLAARAVRAGGDRALADFPGADRALADYLATEVLATLPAGAAEVVGAVSVCAEVPPALAVALSGRDDACAVLSALEREHSLVVSTGEDRRTFRTHPLLRAHALADLTRRRPDRVARLHAVAASWFAEQERHAPAFDHAARTGDPAVCAALVHAHGVPLLMAGDHGPVRRVLTTAGPAAVDGDARLALVSALAHVEALAFAAAAADLARGLRAWPDEPDEELVTLRGLVTATYALTGGTGVEAPDWRALVAATAGGALEAWARLGLGWSLLAAGQRPVARDELARARGLAADHGHDYLALHALAALGALSALSGDYVTMAAECAEAVGIAAALGWHQAPGLTIAHGLLGFARLMHMDPAGALERVAAASAATADPVPADLRHLTDLVRGVAHFDAGNRLAGLKAMRKARVEYPGGGLPVEVLVGGALVEHRSALELGRDAHAREVLAWACGAAGAAPEPSLMRARAALAADRVAEAEVEVRAALAESAEPLWPTTPIEARLLETELEIRHGRRTKARAALTVALALAEESSLLRPFHHAHPSVWRLLREQIGGFGALDGFAARVSRALSGAEAHPGAILTKREQAVLARLSAPGSLDELAADLTVSLNTVKTHIRAIYAKLGVNNRRAAVVAARQLGLT